jgi:hypothetical protein
MLKNGIAPELEFFKWESRKIIHFLTLIPKIIIRRRKLKKIDFAQVLN